MVRKIMLTPRGREAGAHGARAPRSSSNRAGVSTVRLLCGVAALALFASLVSASPADARERKPSDRQAVPRSPESGSGSQATAPRGRSRQPKATGGSSSSRSSNDYYSSSRRRSRGRYGYGYGYGYGHYRHSYYGISPYYLMYHGRYAPYYPYYGPYGYSRHYGPTRSLGAVDLNVKPKKADVYLDGELIGTAGQYDGFPGYLWLEGGEYQLIFHREGYETVVREVKVTADVVVDVRERLEDGVALAVEAFPPAPERAAPAVASRTMEYGSPPPETAPSTELDATTEPGRLKLRVQPGDASVYLDGRFLGTGDDLSRLQAGVMVDPGEHTLEIVRPGFATETVDFEVGSDAQAELVIELQPNVA